MEDVRKNAAVQELKLRKEKNTEQSLDLVPGGLVGEWKRKRGRGRKID